MSDRTIVMAARRLAAAVKDADLSLQRFPTPAGVATPEGQADWARCMLERDAAIAAIVDAVNDGMIACPVCSGVGRINAKEIA